MIIDPLETMIVWLTTALTSLSGRVAGKHRYGNGWTESQTGVSVHLDGGTPDIYANVSVSRLELRIYADDQVAVVDVWRTLVGLCRANKRFAVTVSRGAALVHYAKPTSGLSMIYDEVLKKEVGVVFVESMISEGSAA